jgi:hypothetical protein
MRTTIAIDDEIMEKLREIAFRRHISLRRVIDETLRLGLGPTSKDRVRRRPFRVVPFRSEFRPGVDPERLNQLADELEIRRFAGDPSA